MSEQSATDRDEAAIPAASVKDVLRAELAYGDVMLGTVGPILGHLVLNHDHSLFTDAIIARVRGMLVDVAKQMLDIEAKHVPAQAAPEADAREDTHLDDAPQPTAEEITAIRIENLVSAISGDSAFLEHCHALAIEFQVAERLKSRNSLDPVLTPLIQSFIASKDERVASTAMAALTAQARFMEQQRRMVLPLDQLPAHLSRHAIACWQAEHSVENAESAAAISAALRHTTNAENTRIMLFSDLLTGMGGGITAALSLPHAGVSMFISALAATSGLPREHATLVTNDRQMARLALSLKAAGLKARTIEEQFLYLHPEIELPEDFDTMRPEEARALLAGGSAGIGA